MEGAECKAVSGQGRAIAAAAREDQTRG
ncbi:hypothetical protein HU200_038011 [Digitaria exilis]|uniref:Uncharacterized protein n=1 Tax=Digitaria exilis TaxID=1010633 RepID=A0A835EGW3_9POAL|nr:hypothetical protein HU200_038011 [Digitaria exilis]